MSTQEDIAGAYTAVYEPGKVWVDVRLYEIVGRDDDGSALYRAHDGQMVADVREALCEVSAMIKWDGCANWMWTDGNTHTCERDGLEALTQAMMRAYDRAMEINDSGEHR